MNITRMHWAMLVAMGAVAAGCGGRGGSYTPAATKQVPPATVARGEEASLFPMAVGNQWVYAVEARHADKAGPKSATFEVTFRVASNEGGVAALELLDGTRVVETQQWSVTPKGIYQLTSGPKQVAFSPAQPNVLFPLEENKTFSWQGTGLMPLNGTGTGGLTTHFMGTQVVDTDEGRLSALCFESKGTFKSGSEMGLQRTVAWWAPNVGLVRLRSEAQTPTKADLQIFRLKKSTLKAK